LDAEQIRDSLLAVSGLLDEKRGGPAVMPPAPANFLFGNNRNAWTNSENPHDHHRRSIYVFIRRNMPYPMLDTFDGANPNTVHNRRDVSTTPTQALTLVNSDLVYKWSQSLAGRVISEAGSNEAAQLDRLFQVLFARPPEKDEQQKLLAFLDAQSKITQKQLAAGKKVAVPEGYGVSPAVYAQVDKLYGSLYGRPADRFERAKLVEYVSQQQEKLAAAAGDDDDSEGNASSPSAAEKEKTARAAAFVDLAHALANSNEFSYRF
jgi:hypothetical protein